MDEKKPLQKKRKVDVAKKFTTPEQIRQSLQAQNPDAVVDALNQLKFQLTILPEEGRIGPQDERLLLAQQWLEKSPGAQDVFILWETANPRQPNLLAAIVSALAALVSLLTSHYTYHATGYPIIKALLTPQWTRRLNSYVGGSHNELILVTLKLLNSISGFAGGKEKKRLLDVFQWETKSLPKLFNLRRRGKVDYNPVLRPDIRTLYIFFLFSFLDAPTQTKNAFLEHHRDAFLAIFKGLVQDQYVVVRHILEVIWTHIWTDLKIKRTIKVNLFNEATISHLIKLYERTSADGGDPEHIPADLVHHFLLAIMTRPGTGICFKDRGWYAREDAEDEKGGKIYNRILANIIKTLKVNEDSRQQELARRILEACPELVAGYWSAAQLTLEPRLSTKWIANISFFGAIISLPIPEHAFLLPNTQLYNPTPPPLQTVLSNILPSDVSPKNMFTKGLLSPSGLVQHCSALALAKCLMKYAKVQETFKAIEDALETGETEEGQWGRRRRELEKEVRKRVPEFQVILGFSQHKSTSVTSRSSTTDVSAPNPVKHALLQESAQRLLLLYHTYLPDVVAEARFDVGKILSSFSVTGSNGTDVTDEYGDVPNVARKLQLVQQLHVLRTLKESDQFIWSNKSSTSRTYIYTLLKSYTKTPIRALRATLLDLITHLLSNSILFQEAPTEPQLWLLSLPHLLRAPDATSPDNVKLTDEAESVVTFLDDCIQRCLKTPFRYIEEMRNLSISPSSPTDHGDRDLAHPEIWPSPLVMTVGEQLDAKLKAGLLTPSDVLAIVSFIRKLLFRLSGQLQDLRFLALFSARMDKILSEECLWASKYPATSGAVRMEVRAMHMVLEPVEVEMPMMSTASMRDFLDEMEGLAVGNTNHAQVTLAHSIIDRLRFTDRLLPQTDMKRLFRAIGKHCQPALSDLAEYLFPRSGSLWQGENFVGIDSGHSIPVEWLVYNSTRAQMLNPKYHRTFLTTLFSTPFTPKKCLELIKLIDHRLCAADEEEARGLLSLLAALASEASSVFKDADMITLKEGLFVRYGAVKRMAMSQSVGPMIHSGLRELLQSSFDPRSAVDRRILSEISAYWFALLRYQLDSGICDKYGDTALWIKYLPQIQALELFDRLTSGDIVDTHTIPLLQSILEIIQASTNADADGENVLHERIPQLLKIRKQIVDSPIAEDLLLSAIDSTIPLGSSPFRPRQESDGPMPLKRLTRYAKMRWIHRTRPLGCPLPLEDFLQSQTWTLSTVKIISNLVYKQPFPLEGFQNWLRSDHTTRSTEHLAFVIGAALDVLHCALPEDVLLDPEAWSPHVSRISSLCFNHETTLELKYISSLCISSALDVFKQKRGELIKVLIKQLEDHKTLPPSVILRIGCRHPAPELTSALLEPSIQWLISHLADNTLLSADTSTIVDDIVALIQLTTSIKTHQVETLLSVIIQGHLSNPQTVGLANECLLRTHLKPVAVNRYIQNILQHPQFRKLSNGISSDPTSKSYIVKLLYTLFNLHPTNTCQITQVGPLLQIYRGTLCKTDLQLFSIFQLFELQRKTSLASLFNCWSPLDNITPSSALESLQSLDPTKILRTALHFPKWRKVQNNLNIEVNNHDAQLYDPVFLILFLNLVLTGTPPSTGFGWVEVFRSNIVGLCLRFLSSKDANLRELGMSQIASLYKHIEDVEFQEKAHVIYVLDLFKDLFPPPPQPNENEAPRRLPSYTTLLLTHAIRGIFYPANFISPLTARFLLQRPELDVTDVPMLYSMLYSSSDDWRKERGWMMRFLADGMVSSDDWRVLKRRHTWDLLASIFQSSSDRSLRRGTFEVLANLTCHSQVVMSLVLKSSILAWIEMQISRANIDESLEWIGILGNVTLSVNCTQLDSTLGTAWRDRICRCLTLLLKRSNSKLALPAAVPIIFKLSLLPDPLTYELQNVINTALMSLKLLEDHVEYRPEYSPRDHVTLVYVLRPGHAIHEPPATPCLYQAWLECATLLWRTTMNLGRKVLAWDLLTFRVLANRLNGDTSESEWVRKEVVRCMQKHDNYMT